MQMTARHGVAGVGECVAIEHGPESRVRSRFGDETACVAAVVVGERRRGREGGRVGGCDRAQIRS